MRSVSAASSDEENPENVENEAENDEEEDADEEEEKEEEKINSSNHVFRGSNQRIATSFQPHQTMEVNPARNHNLEFLENMNEESDSSGGNYGSNLNSE